MIFPCPRSRLNIWYRETGSAVPSRVSLLIPHTQDESGAYSWASSRFPLRRPFICLYRHTPSGQSRVFWVTQLRTDSVHCGESGGTGSVVLSVVPVMGAAFAGHHGPINVRLSFPTPTTNCWYGSIGGVNKGDYNSSLCSWCPVSTVSIDPVGWCALITRGMIYRRRFSEQSR